MIAGVRARRVQGHRLSPERPAPGERWRICAAHHVHWGANGGAGLLLRHKPEGAEPKYLLARRSRWVDNSGTWGIPGGAIRDDEMPEDAARRETFEEIGYLPPYRVSDVDTQDCGGGWPFHIIVADVDNEFQAYCMSETDETGWFTASALASLPLHPGVRRWLDEEAD
jgi:8-oxo-dGTP pyrophosphatase MutT (NUDIX family)